VYRTSNPYSADIKIFQASNRFGADVVVYFASNPFSARGDCGYAAVLRDE
jgi:hypothetical protein